MRTFRFFFLLVSLLFWSVAISQNVKVIDLIFHEIQASDLPAGEDLQIKASTYRLYELSIDSLLIELEGISEREVEDSAFIAEIRFPHPNGKMHAYHARSNRTMAPGLKEKFPEIRTFDAYGVNSSANVKWDITPHGLHAMILRPGKPTIFIDPAIRGNSKYYIIYRRDRFQSNEQINCRFDSDDLDLSGNEVEFAAFSAFGGCELRTYSLALAATAEYTTYHGGTVALAQAAQVTTMNRVNGIYERDMAITMTIISNNNLIIYTNSSTDPYSNGQASTMLSENQTNLDAVIGSSNYDIGHVFGTNSGGVAYLGSVCSSFKAGGVTGSSAPINDPFDVDYVSHEIGHQFGATHTFNNSCNGNRTNSTAMEPGSGSTILAYAGICSPNVQNFSDDHFHGISLENMEDEVQSIFHTCETITPLTNNEPVINNTNGNVHIPKSTPFVLTANATDADGDVMTYCWEQMDNGIATMPPSASSTLGPGFRSLSPSNDSSRYFPRLQDLANGTSSTWEVLSDVGRTYNFRITVRDNASGAGGCTDHEDVTLTVDGNAGPFVVTYPGATGISLVGATTTTVTWDVANTDLNPVNCSQVDILLSVDGGLTYPHVLSTGVPNSGSRVLNLPNIATTQARVMVISDNRSFFDISDNNFTITLASNDFSLSLAPSTLSLCQLEQGVFSIDVGVIGSFSNPVQLSATGVPMGVNLQWSSTSITPPATATVTLTTDQNSSPDSYSIGIHGQSTTGTKTSILDLYLSNGSPTAVQLSTPAHNTTVSNTTQLFSWVSSSNPGITYDFQLSKDPALNSLVHQATGLTSNQYSQGGLEAWTSYYWRVRGVTGCTTGPWSSTFRFELKGCIIIDAYDTPISISSSGTPIITSTIYVPDDYSILDVNIWNINGQHTYVSDLTVKLKSPEGTEIILWDDVCGTNDDFDLNFDDDAASSTLPCPPTDGGTYQPDNPFSNFTGEDSQGNWILTINDHFNIDGGSLDHWELELCLASPACTLADVPTVIGDLVICEGESTSLSIGTGNLNDNTSWKWYSSSCGGTLIGTGTSINYAPLSSTTVYVRGEGGCSSAGNCQSVSLTVNPASSSSEIVSSCGSYTWNENGQTYFNSGSYSVTSTNSDGCMHTATLVLTINQSTSSSETVTACDGYIWVENGQTYLSSGTYMSTSTNSDGCLHTSTLNLTINQNTSSSESVTACDSYTWSENGQTYLTSGTYMATSTNSDGCIHTAVLNATINQSSSSSLNITACDSYTWSENGTTYLSSGTYTATSTNIDGCLHTSTLILSINQSSSSTQTVIACDSYTWGVNGQTYFSSGTYSANAINNDGCIHTLILNLTINSSTSSTETVTACDSYTWDTNGQTYLSSGTYVAQTTNSDGCPHTSTLNLTLIQSTSQSVSVTSCDSYTWVENGMTYFSSGVYALTSTNIDGCLHSEILDLTINQSTSSFQTVTACDIYTWDENGTAYFSSGIYSATSTNSEGCLHTATLDLTINQSTTSSTSVTFCDSYTWSENGQTYLSSEIYSATSTNSEGCLHTATLDLTINQSTTSSTSVTSCDSYTWPENGQTYLVSGTYAATSTNSDGCLHTSTLNLTINQSTSSSETVSSCDSYMWSENGQTYLVSGTYMSTSTNNDGCLHTSTLNLTINQSASSSEIVTACDSYMWSENGQIYLSSGTYTATSTNNYGCLHTSSLNLTINQSTSSSETIVTCDSYMWSENGQIYLSSGTYMATSTNNDGCLHTSTLNVTINQSTSGSETVTACDSYMWIENGQTYLSSGTFSTTSTNSEGCLHTDTLDLTINQSTTSSTSVTSCDSYTWPENGQTYLSSGTYTTTSTNSDGCLHTSTLNLNINQSTSSSETVTACDSYTWSENGQTYLSSGSYMATSTNSDGCLHTSSLNLTINQSTSSSETIVTCDSYMWSENGQIYLSSGTYMATSTNNDGCTHTATLNLTINQSTSSTETVSACMAYTWNENNQTYLSSGVYTATSTNSEGCLHTAILDLTIHLSATSSELITACDSYNWSANGQTYLNSGNYTVTLTTINGCDSVCSLDLTILESSSEILLVDECEGYTSPSGKYWDASGTYFDTIPNMLGCDSLLEIQLSIIEIDTMVVSVDSTLTANQAGALYRWLNCGNGYAPIAGEINQSFTAQLNGSYAVEITLNGCVDTSYCYVVSGIGLEENVVLNNVRLYPNPNRGQLFIEFDVEVEYFEIEVHDMLGKLIQRQAYSNRRAVELFLEGASAQYVVTIWMNSKHQKSFTIFKE